MAQHVIDNPTGRVLRAGLYTAVMPMSATRMDRCRRPIEQVRQHSGPVKRMVQMELVDLGIKASVLYDHPPFGVGLIHLLRYSHSPLSPLSSDAILTQTAGSSPMFIVYG